MISFTAKAAAKGPRGPRGASWTRGLASALPAAALTVGCGAPTGGPDSPARSAAPAPSAAAPLAEEAPPAAAPLPTAPLPTAPGQPRNALLLVIDTLRADVVAEVRTPVFDALARQGSAAPLAWSAGTWTAPSVVSLFTGASVRTHGWDLPSARLGRYPALPSLPTLAEVLRDAGFVTDGLYTNPYLAEDIGFDRGFARWRRTVDARVPAELAELARGWDDGQRHFAYVHLLGPHSPIRLEEDARQRWGLEASWFTAKMGFEIGVAKRDRPQGGRAAYAKAYRGAVEAVDAVVGEVLAALGDQRADTVIIVTSDHGELLGEHGVVGHGSWLWEPLVHVPLVAVGPGAPTLPSALSNAAVPDLLCRALGVPHAWPLSADAALPLVASREGQLALSPDGQRKGIWREGVLSVYDLGSDPGELRAAEDDGALARARQGWERQTAAGLSLALQPEPARRSAELEALGYQQPDPETK